MNEADTRATLIDPQLRTAGWELDDHSQVSRELPISGHDPTPWQGDTDYCLFDESGNVLAIVEAKKTSRDPHEVDAGSLLATCIAEASPR